CAGGGRGTRARRRGGGRGAGRRPPELEPHAQRAARRAGRDHQRRDRARRRLRRGDARLLRRHAREGGLGGTAGRRTARAGAGGNVLPRLAFRADDGEALRLGRLLALEAQHAVGARAAWPRRLTRSSGWSEMSFSLYGFEPLDGEAPALAAVEERVLLPLQP